MSYEKIFKTTIEEIVFTNHTLVIQENEFHYQYYRCR